MALKKFKPVTPGRRQMTMASFEEITTNEPEKSLIKILKRHSGRNNSGQITCRHRGGGEKKFYRIIDFKGGTDKLNMEAKVQTIEYDPYRTCYIMLLNYKDGEKRYQIAPLEVKVGDEIVAKERGKVKPGNRMQVKHIPIGFSMYNIELKPGKGGQMGRSAGASIKLVSLEGEYAQIQMQSGEVRLISKECYASVGQVGNIDHNNIVYGTAGRRRHMGWKPTVAGSAMIPKDHPHGGGKGHTSIGLIHPKTPWGMPALGYKTRTRKYTDRMIVKDRRR
ncbi:MAG: 50S ribosomal protein L2 [Candidatus Peregrinibacteria bacterium]|nr:50S ribosomal protein L2 [Candidatus Peregrinibacteria bacterium]